MNGLPVMATPSISPASARVRCASMTPSSSSRVTGPRVFGRVWSRPLSRVMSAIVRPLAIVTSLTYERVTTSSSPLIATSSEKSMVV